MAAAAAAAAAAVVVPAPSTASSNSLMTPQHATFAHSKDDVLKALSFYFGEPVSPEKLRDYNEHHASTYHFPDAYAGSNQQLRDTINNLIEKSPQTWHTTIGLPFRRIEGTVVEWDEIRFDVRLMQRVPYEGVSRMTTSMKRKHRDRVVRRGLGLIVESDFYTTPAGRAHFANQLQSIRYCVQETCNYDVLFAYLTCANYDFAYDKTHNVRPRRNIRAAMQKEVSVYAIAQKDRMGLDKVVEDSKYAMKRYGVSPNLLVIPPQLSLYMALAPEEKLTYKEAGPVGQSAFEAGVEGFETRAFRGCGVVTSDPFEVSDDQEAVQMLQRFTQVGEFYVIDPRIGDAAHTGENAAIMIYDEECDKYAKITYDEAYRAATENWPQANGADAKPTVKDNGGKHTHVMIVARPFIEHAMLSAVLAVSGSDTGATCFGPSDMQLSANTSVKTIEGHYTGHFKAVVAKPQNVKVLRDVMANGYRAGGNARFFSEDGVNADGTKKFDIKKAKEAIMRRLAFEDGDNEDYPASLLAFPMPFTQYDAGKCSTVMSLTSRLLPWEVQGGNHASFPGGETSFGVYNRILALQQVHFGEDLRASENMDYISQGSTNNALCFLGPHRTFDPIKKDYVALTPGQGHWGPDARPGDARWRRGEAVSMVTARDSLLGIDSK